MQKLFKIFGKLNDPNQINVEGTGLGLYITSNLVNQLGGTIQVESEFEKFTLFTIRIPEHQEVIFCDKSYDNEEEKEDKDKSIDERDLS